MMSYIKIIILLFTIIATISTTNAFVSKSVVSKKAISSINGGVGNISSSRYSHSIAYRISKPTLSSSLVCNTQLSMATATPTAPAPTKKKEKEEEVETEKAKDRGWLVRLFNDVSLVHIYIIHYYYY